MYFFNMYKCINSCNLTYWKQYFLLSTLYCFCKLQVKKILFPLESFYFCCMYFFGSKIYKILLWKQIFLLEKKILSPIKFECYIEFIFTIPMLRTIINININYQINYLDIKSFLPSSLIQLLLVECNRIYSIWSK